MTVKIGLTYVNATPLYVVRSFSQHQVRVYGGVHSDKSGNWYHPAYYPFHNKALGDYKAIFESFELSPKALTFWGQQERLANSNAVDLLSDDFTWVTTPDTYQKSSTAHALASLRSGMFLDCGLGKTKVIIDTIRYLRWAAEEKVDTPFIVKSTRPKVLCVVKSSVLWNWPDEIEKHSLPGEFKVAVVDGYNVAKKKAAIVASSDADFLIATYEQLARGDYADLVVKHFKYDTIVADESHKLQTWASTNTQTAVKLAKRAYRRIIATGTATLGDPRHTYGQMFFLAPHMVGGSYYRFCENHLKKAPHNNKIVVGYKNLARLNAKIHSVGVVVKIDDKIETTRRTVTVPVEMAKKQRRVYNDLLDTHEATHPVTGESIRFPEAITRLGKVHELCGGFLNFHNRDPAICNGCEFMEHCVDNAISPYTTKCKVVQKKPVPSTLELDDNPKLDVMMSKLEDVLQDPTNAVIITFRFRKDVDYIRAALVKQGVKFLEVTQATSAKKLHTLATEFEEDGTVRVFLAQISTLVGINLVRAKYIFFYSLSFDLKDYEQARGRNYRRTQKAPEVFEYIFYMKDTVESVILEALRSKTEVKDLLLTRVDCATCSQSLDTCTLKKILPWKRGCVLKNTKDKVVMRLGGGQNH